MGVKWNPPPSSMQSVIDLIIKGEQDYTMYPVANVCAVQGYVNGTYCDYTKIRLTCIMCSGTSPYRMIPHVRVVTASSDTSDVTINAEYPLSNSEGEAITLTERQFKVLMKLGYYTVE